MLKNLASILFLFIFTHVNAQFKTDDFLKNLLLQSGDTMITKLVQSPMEYRLQIIYTQIDRDVHNNPTFKPYYFNVNPKFYFNPASTVKLPAALVALEKLNEIHKQGVNKYSSLQIDSSFEAQTREYVDTSAQSGLPSIGQFIRRAFLVSENDPYTRLYEFNGQGYFNRKLREKGFIETRITRRFTRMTPEQNRHTNQVRFLNGKGNTIYTQPPAYNPDSFDFSQHNLIGKGYLNANDSLINEPIDFTTANNLPLEELLGMLKLVLFPETAAPIKRWNLTKDDYHFVYQYLSQFPGETNYPKYDAKTYYDSYVKFYFRDSAHAMPPGLRVFNKVGWAYGFLTDASYVADFKNKTEYMLACTLYVNGDGILNDNKYEYDEIGWPFMKGLGKLIYEYELKRKKKYPPNLDRFYIKYETRSKTDKRPAIKIVDN